MNRYYFTFGFEFLEPRHLLALPAGSLSAEHSAEIAELPHAEVAASGVAVVPVDFSLGVENNARGFVLKVQLLHLDSPRLVGIVGGPASWTDSAGTAELLLPQGASRIELTIADHPLGEVTPFLRIEFDRDLHVANYERMVPSPGSEHEAMSPIAMSLLAPSGSLSPGNMSSSGVNPSASHHANGAGSVQVSKAFHSDSGHLADLTDLSSGQYHSHGWGSSGVSPQSSGVVQPSASAAINVGMEVRSGATASGGALHHPMDSVPVPPMQDDLPMAEEVADALFAEWGEEVEPVLISQIATVAMSAPIGETVADESTTVLTSHGEIPAERAILAREPESGSTWQIATAIAIAASSVGGAFWLERHARRKSKARCGIISGPRG